MKVIGNTLSSMSGISGLLAVSALVLTLVAPVRAQEREYTTIPTPLGTLSSTAFGINARGEVVGTFVDQSFVQHGFLLSKGEFTVIDFPGAQGTIARGIGPSGEIVGNYWLPGDNALLAARGFLRTKKAEFLNVRYGDPDPQH